MNCSVCLVMGRQARLVTVLNRRRPKAFGQKGFESVQQERSPSDEDLPVVQPGLGLIFPPVSGTTEAYSDGANSFFLSPNSIQNLIYIVVYFLY